jgi:hypothetical protein
MKLYEYRKTRIKREAQLLLMGRDSWQLVSVTKGFWSFLLGRQFYFKRELPNPYYTITNRGAK